MPTEKTVEIENLPTPVFSALYTARPPTYGRLPLGFRPKYEKYIALACIIGKKVPFWALFWHVLTPKAQKTVKMVILGS